MQGRTIISMAVFIHKQFSSWEFKNKFANPRFMNLSQYFKHSLFASFSASSKAAFWSTYSSMSCEAALKSAKKYIKNPILKLLG